ncbi:uncharacterized protein V1513DRAFT_463027 [Lipomyces chichibuensis]|uniref:uncharacterized protein n=1 Tax=Lipomyces chichibuensis TaxID=1546026 RepID=UPI003343C4BC
MSEPASQDMRLRGGEKSIHGLGVRSALSKIFSVPSAIASADFCSIITAGKYVGQFVSTGTPGGGQEVTVLNALSTYTHHGMIFVPLGYSHAFPQMADLTEVHGSSPWGAGTFAGTPWLSPTNQP